jgi:AraC-like DNA-binding protein
MAIPQGDTIREVTMRPMQAVFVSEHTWNHPLHTVAHSFMTLDFKPEFTRYYCRRNPTVGLWPADQACYFKTGSIHTTGLHLIRALESLARDDASPQSVAALVTTLIREAHADCTPPDESSDSRSRAAWRLLCDHIDENLHRPLDRNSLAKRVGMHPNHVSRLFRTCGGESLSSYIARRRMERAQELLSRYDLLVKEVASRCGFAEPAYFNNVFRKHVGRTPLQFRARARRT